MSEKSGANMGETPPDESWLAKVQEPILDPDLPIVDPHHHLWMRGGYRYLMPELAADLASGHNIVSTVYAECRSMYRPDGPESERPLGETEFVTGCAAMAASGAFGPAKACAAMFGKVDMTLGAAVRPLLEQHLERSAGRFKGVRYSTGWSASDRIPNAAAAEGLLVDPAVVEAARVLAEMGLTLDSWLYHPQLADVAKLADAVPNLAIVLNHVGTPILGGPYRDRHDEVFRDWRRGIAEVAARPNVYIKLGALPIRMPGDGADRSPAADFGGDRRRVGAVDGGLHRSIRARTLHVRIQLPGTEALVELPDDLERLQTHRRRRLGRRKARPVRRRRRAGLSAGGAHRELITLTQRPGVRSPSLERPFSRTRRSFANFFTAIWRPAMLSSVSPRRA